MSTPWPVIQYEEQPDPELNAATPWSPAAISVLPLSLPVAEFPEWLAFRRGVVDQEEVSEMATSVDSRLFLYNNGAKVAVSDDQPVPVRLGSALAAFNFEAVTVDDTATGLTEATYDDAVRAVVTVEDASVRVRYDGTDPTASSGHLLEPGDVFPVEGAANIAGFKAIRTGADDAVLMVTYEH